MLAKARGLLQGVVVRAMNPGPEAGGSLNSRPAWSADQVPGQPGLPRETVFRKKQKVKRKKLQKSSCSSITDSELVLVQNEMGEMERLAFSGSRVSDSQAE